jgi:hypothetical protein
MHMNKLLTWGAIILGIVGMVCAYVYVTTPAGSLPGFMPGFESGVTTIHYKHAIGSFILALALFAFAWFKSAPAKHG